MACAGQHNSRLQQMVTVVTGRAGHGPRQLRPLLKPKRYVEATILDLRSLVLSAPTHRLGRVLYNRPLFFRIETGEGMHNVIADPRSLDLVMGELISLSAFGVAFNADSVAGEFVEQDPGLFRKQISRIDSDKKVHDKLISVILPLAEESGVEFEDGQLNSMVAIEEDTPEDKFDEFTQLAHELYTLMLGMEYGLHVELDYGWLRRAARNVRLRTERSEAIAWLSSLEGLLNCYSVIDAPCIRAVPSDHKENSALFRSLVDDESYRALSKEAHELGVPSRSAAARHKMSRLIRDITGSRPFSGMLTIGSVAIGLASQVSVDLKQLSPILSRHHYLPPIVDLQAAYNAAKLQWLSRGPEYVDAVDILEAAVEKGKDNDEGAEPT